jgi:CheY-like chemotaxis protein
MTPLSILVIDDDTALMDVIRNLLESQGHRVTAAADGTEGLAALDKETFGLVLTDVFFPGRDGVEVIIERCKREPATPVIAMSGSGKFASDHYLQLVKKLGADVILRKPFGGLELFAAIDTACGA